MAQFFVITPFVSPTTPGFDWLWNDNYWRAADWVEWHRQMRKEFGKKEAERRFLSAWQQLGYTDFLYRNNMLDDQNFYEYFEEQGILVGGEMRATIDNIQDTINDVGNTAQNILNILPWVAIIIGVFILIYVVLNITVFSKAAGTVGGAAGKAAPLLALL